MNGKAFEGLIRVRLAADAEPALFEKRLYGVTAVADAWRLAGDCDYEVRVACPTLPALDATISELRDAGALTSTTLILHRVSLDDR